MTPGDGDVENVEPEDEDAKDQVENEAVTLLDPDVTYLAAGVSLEVADDVAVKPMPQDSAHVLRMQGDESVAGEVVRQLLAGTPALPHWLGVMGPPCSVEVTLERRICLVGVPSSE